MKKKHVKSLQLNKKSISSLGTSSIKGGTGVSLLCPFTQKCLPTDDCTIGCPPPPSAGCPVTEVCIKTAETCTPWSICLG